WSSWLKIIKLLPSLKTDASSKIIKLCCLGIKSHSEFLACKYIRISQPFIIYIGINEVVIECFCWFKNLIGYVYPKIIKIISVYQTQIIDVIFSIRIAMIKTIS